MTSAVPVPTQDAARELDPAVMPRAEIYGLLTATVAPRPIAWVSTRDAAGESNLAPHSYFTVLSHQPSMLGFVSVGRKDTLRNVEATGEYVINVAGEDLIAALNTTAANAPPGESEFPWAGVTPEPAARVSAPRVAEAPVAFELRLVEVKPTGDSFLIIGEVIHVRIAERVLRNDRVAPDLLQPVGRMAGATYARTGDRFDLARPTFADLQARADAPTPAD